MISPMAVHSLDVAQLEPEFARDGGDGGTAKHTRRATWFHSTLINFALERDESYRFSSPKINANASSQRKNEQLKKFQIVVTISAELVTP